MNNFFRIALVALAFALASCTPQKPVFRILAGSESQEIEPVIKAFGQTGPYDIQLSYEGSIEIMLELEKPTTAFDAVLPANSMWLRMGDQKLHRVRDEKSIMRTPVVLGIKRSKAQALGWIGRKVTVKDVLAAIDSGKLHFAMTSATQSNSGASAYIGILYALAGSPQALTAAQLDDPALADKVKRFLKGVNRSSGSSGWLKDLVVQQYDTIDAMMNYESMVISANKELVAAGREPLYVVYPTDGLAIADDTLAFVKHGDSKEDLAKQAFFDGLVEYLGTDASQAELRKTGFRAGTIGIGADGADPAVFNPAWGVDLSRTISPIVWPEPAVINRALTLYQTALRKPSMTAFVLDYSGSMEGKGVTGLRAAMDLMLDQNDASQYFLQATAKDKLAVIPFSSAPIPLDGATSGIALADGNDTQRLTAIREQLHALNPDGGTDIYTPIERAFDYFKSQGKALDGYLPAVILMTDGMSNGDATLNDLVRYWASLGMTAPMPPVFCITFGEADDTQLKALASATHGRVFDGRTDLSAAFRAAKGYN